MAAAFVRISDWSPRYSLDKTGRELLYLPLTPVARKKLKVFIDVFVDRTGRAAAAPVILACVSLGLGLRGNLPERRECILAGGLRRLIQAELRIE